MDTHGVPITDFVFGLKSLAAADLIPIKTNNGDFAEDGGGEGVRPDTKAMFAAASQDKLPAFLATHPEMLISDGAGGGRISGAGGAAARRGRPAGPDSSRSGSPAAARRRRP